MYDSPRIRRLRSDLAAMERLRDESSVLRFRASGKPTQHYVIELRGKSLARQRGKVGISEKHEIEIKLGSSYPRTMPELRWLTPIYHPNISEVGMVCLGGYGTHWVPSLNLDELCGMLWDMARYHNYDVRSPYNRDAALWVANQTNFTFPLDSRPLRDLRAALGRIESTEEPKDEARNAVAMQPTSTSLMPDDRNSWSEKYSAFVRRFAEDLRTITPSSPDVEPHGMSAPSEDMVVLEESAPIQSPIETPEATRLRTLGEEIIFIE
jgi:ubiquitin-protein ligase